MLIVDHLFVNRIHPVIISPYIISEINGLSVGVDRCVVIVVKIYVIGSAVLFEKIFRCIFLKIIQLQLIGKETVVCLADRPLLICYRCVEIGQLPCKKSLGVLIDREE